METITGQELDSTPYIVFSLRSSPEKKEDLWSVFVGAIIRMFRKELGTIQHWKEMPHKRVASYPFFDIFNW